MMFTPDRRLTLPTSMSSLSGHSRNQLTPIEFLDQGLNLYSHGIGRFVDQLLELCILHAEFVSKHGWTYLIVYLAIQHLEHHVAQVPHFSHLFLAIRSLQPVLEFLVILVNQGCLLGPVDQMHQ